MEPTDEELLLACRRADADAWEALVRRYQRLIYTIPRRAGLNEDLAAEVFQRVFARLVQKIDDIEQPSRIGAWLTTLARRETWRVIQQEARSATTSLTAEDDDFALLPDAGSLPDELMVQLEEQHQIRRALATLGERCVKLLTLLYYQPEPPTYSEIAATLDMSLGSIGPTRARCLEKLKQRLDDQGFG